MHAGIVAARGAGPQYDSLRLPTTYDTRGELQPGAIQPRLLLKSGHSQRLDPVFLRWLE